MLAHVGRLKKRMAEDDLDGIVAATAENIHYLTGISSVSLHLHPYFGQCYAVITRDAPERVTLVSSTGEIDQVLDSTAQIADAVNFGTFYRERYGDDALPAHEQRLYQMTYNPAEPNGAAALASAIKRIGLAGKRVGLDEAGLRIGVEDAVKRALPETKFISAHAALAWVRRVKTQEEIIRIGRSARITEQAIQAAAAIARTGVTEHELYLEFNRSVASQGGRAEFTMIKFGRNGIGGQVLSNRTGLQKGDTIWFDVGSSYLGYWSDLARTFSFGEPSARIQALYRAMVAGEQVGIDKTRPGMTGSDVFHLTMQGVRDNGEPRYRRHHVGHSIGAEVYEQPILADGNGVTIEAGMVINIETPYYEFGVGAVHVENPFVVSESGPNVLLTSGSPRELVVLS
ncbi:MAG: M24 family metallopeptidase [Afipia sp.]